jgi:hypothetical protein
MPSLAHQQILVAAKGLLLAVILIPNPAHSAQENWVDEIAQRVRAEYNLTSPERARSGYERYLLQLQSVQDALGRGNVAAVQTEMRHFVRMLAVKDGDISDSSAESLLFYLSEVTPVEYLDLTTRTHLRHIRDMVTFRTEAREEVPTDFSYALTVPPKPASESAWPFEWRGRGTMNPIIILGTGMLVLVAIGVMVFLIVGIGGASANGQSASHTKGLMVEGLEAKTPSPGSSRDAA